MVLTTQKEFACLNSLSEDSILNRIQWSLECHFLFGNGHFNFTKSKKILHYGFEAALHYDATPSDKVLMNYFYQ